MRLTSPAIVALAAALAQSVSAAVLKIQIPPSTLLQNPNNLPASTHATLTSGKAPPIHAPLRRDNVFEFDSIIESGSYLLDIFSRDYTFAPYRIDVDSEGAISAVYETYRGTQWSDHGVALLVAPSLDVTVQAKVLSKKKFFEEREGFSPLTLFKNPMILLGVVALGLTFGMPKLMENMDPEMKAEYEEMQKKSPVGGIMGAMQGQSSGGSASNFDLAGWMAGAQQKAGQSSKSSGTEASASIREKRK